eukprot:770732_1
MQQWCQLLTRTVNYLDNTRKEKIDLLKQLQHKKAKDKEEQDTKEEGKDNDDIPAAAAAMDVDIDTKDGGESESDSKKDGTFETQEISKINLWISEIINKCFDLEFTAEYIDKPNEWWKPQ